MIPTLTKPAERSSAMIEALGIDLEAWIMRGVVEPDEDSNIVLRCAACDEADACDELLSEVPCISEAPVYCRNKPLFDQLLV